ncbi:MAG: SAM-dependent methyltransferase [Elainellaceae cyanobacterium]
MAMKLEKVVPFGRSLDEYTQMFRLSEADLAKQILGVGDGPASFNAEATKQGSKVISIDPIYEFSCEEILQRFNEVVDNIIDQIKATPDDWVWTYHKSPNHLRQNRVRVIEQFLADYEQGKAEGRYQVGMLPKLAFADNQFDLALCSHFLFLYSEHYDLQFHQAAIEEMLRVSHEVRIFPLLTLMLERSPYLDAIVQNFQEMGYQVAIETVPYELQKGGNQMLRIWKEGNG